MVSLFTDWNFMYFSLINSPFSSLPFSLRKIRLIQTICSMKNKLPTKSNLDTNRQQKKNHKQKHF